MNTRWLTKSWQNILKAPWCNELIKVHLPWMWKQIYMNMLMSNYCDLAYYYEATHMNINCMSDKTLICLCKEQMRWSARAFLSLLFVPIPWQYVSLVFISRISILYLTSEAMQRGSSGRLDQKHCRQVFSWRDSLWTWCCTY